VGDLFSALLIHNSLLKTGSYGWVSEAHSFEHACGRLNTKYLNGFYRLIIMDLDVTKRGTNEDMVPKEKSVSN
jgi:hypothetical protein